MIRICLFIILIFCIFTQCQPNKASEETAEINTDSLQVQLTTITDSMHISWTTLIESDNLKIQQIKDLLKNISQSCKYDKTLYTQLINQEETLLSKRYTNPDSLTNDQIDFYDSATDSLLTDLTVFYEKTHATTCCVSCDSLEKKIDSLTSQVATLRRKYDNYTEEYNALIIQQKEALSTINSEYKNLKPRQLFSPM